MTVDSALCLLLYMSKCSFMKFIFKLKHRRVMMFDFPILFCSLRLSHSSFSRYILKITFTSCSFGINLNYTWKQTTSTLIRISMLFGPVILWISERGKSSYSFLSHVVHTHQPTKWNIKCISLYPASHIIQHVSGEISTIVFEVCFQIQSIDVPLT